jgi:hypothetical protein
LGGPFQFDSEEEHRSIIHGSTDWRYRNPLQPGNKPARAESDIRDFILTRGLRAHPFAYAGYPQSQICGRSLSSYAVIADMVAGVVWT